MTTPDATRTAEVDALVLTRRASAGQHLLAAGVDVVVPAALAAVAVVAFVTGAEGIGWILLLAAIALAAASVATLARTGRPPGRIAAGTRTVDRSTGAAAGASVVPAFFAGRLRTLDLNRGRDPFAPALAPLVFPDAASVRGPAQSGMDSSGQLMTEFELPAWFFEYKGTRLRYRSGGGSWQRVDVEGPLTLERFPEALEFSSDPDDPWVMLPTSAFDARYTRTVSGRWHGAPVSVGSAVKRGLNRGLVQVNYEGNRPDEAKAAGLSGNQNDGWSALVDPAEIEDVTVTETMFPMVRS